MRSRATPGILPVLRPAFVTFFLGTALVAFGWYAALKGAYISYSFSSLVVERNLIYLTPLLFVGTALVRRHGRRRHVYSR
jgi:hypothetical protein